VQNLGGGDQAANVNVSLRLIHSPRYSLPQHGRFGMRPAPLLAKQLTDRVLVPKRDSPPARLQREQALP